VFPLTDVVHFLAHKLAGLGARRLTRALVFASPLDGLLFWHVNLQ
jgi:hypothetical protein